MAFREHKVLNTNLYKNKVLNKVFKNRIYIDSLLVVVTDLVKITNLSQLIIFPGN